MPKKEVDMRNVHKYLSTYGLETGMMAHTVLVSLYQVHGDETIDKFIDCYFAANKNPVQAYIDCFYPPDNPWKTSPSYQDAATTAKIILDAPEIKQRIKTRQDAVNRKEFNTPSVKVLAELATVAFSNPLDFLAWDDDGNIELLASENIPRSLAAAIKSVERGKDGELKITMHDKLKALDLLGKHFRLFTDSIEVNGELIDRIENARRRLIENN